MNTSTADLLDGEKVVQTKGANAIISVKEHGLSRFAYDQLMWTVGITGLVDKSVLIAKKLQVATHTQQFEFVVWGVPAFIAQINEVKKAISPKKLKCIRRAASQGFGKCGEGLKVFAAMEAINVRLLTAQKIGELVDLAQTPLEIASVLKITEKTCSSEGASSFRWPDCVNHTVATVISSDWDTKQASGRKYTVSTKRRHPISMFSA